MSGGVQKESNTMKRILCYILLCASFFSCKSKDAIMQEKIQGIKDMTELGTVEYTIRKIFKADDAVWYKYGDRKILFTSTSYLKAGINLGEFSPTDVTFDRKNKTVNVTLPKASLLSFNMPEENIELVYSHVSGFRQDFDIKEREILKKQAEEAILEDIPNLGILQDAEQNAEGFFTAMFNRFGYETITVNFK